MGKLNPFRTKEYGGWGNAEPDPDAQDNTAALRKGQAKAAAQRVVQECRKCTNKVACGKHARQWQTARGF